ncbi:MAG: ATP-dependent DNA helicase RecG, partial [Actinomycetes bacterium]
VLGRVGSVSQRQVGRRRSMVVADIRDATGSVRCTFFNQPWRERQLRALADRRTEVAVFGRVDEFRGRAQLTNPVVDAVGDRTGRIVPVYPQSDAAGLSTWELAGWVSQALRRSAARTIADPVPPGVLAAYGLIDRFTALQHIHEPSTLDDVGRARARLVFDELLRLQLALVLRKVELERSALGHQHVVADDDGPAPGIMRRFVGQLPYPLTGAQERVISEIQRDLSGPVPMHRLLQGDVGAGKTVVALAAMLTAVQGGHQAALMAPTEVLAEQHLASMTSLIGDVAIEAGDTLLGSRPLGVALLTGRVGATERRRVVTGLADGTVDLVVGTHALIQDGVSFHSLGVVVVDEQHRFGVEQRAALRSANADGIVPDVLVMTATPIPRTAAMTVYGDLDVSVLDELPPGRTPITTTWAATEEEVDATWGLVRREVASGHRCYVVCPLVEESEKLLVASAESTLSDLEAGPLSGLSLGMLHGRMSSADKHDVMERFRNGDVQVLVATTVVEVGVDVPEATVMVILDAERFGIAQLHQLRGRVGRGAAASHCVLVTARDISPDGVRRVEALVRTTDGFELAEVDLDLRGEGTVMGERQTGRNDLRLASLRRERE